MIRNFIENHGIEFYENISLKKYNTYKLYVKCDFIVFPDDLGTLILLLNFLKENNIKYLVLGNGSNVIFKNEKFNGVIIKLDRLNNITFNDTLVEVEAGYSLIKLSMECLKRSISGFEFASGIPGVIGASVAMNAGAYKESMSDIVEQVTVINPNLEIVTLSNDELEFSYRDSFLKRNKDYIVVSVVLKLNSGSAEEIEDLISKRRIKRIETQPLDAPSAGSVFRNPEGFYAGELIEKCGLKGYKIGGAMVSEKHANFIVNDGDATGKDIISLIEYIKKEVKNKFNIDLVEEQLIIE